MGHNRVRDSRKAVPALSNQPGSPLSAGSGNGASGHTFFEKVTKCVEAEALRKQGGCLSDRRG